MPVNNEYSLVSRGATLHWFFHLCYSSHHWDQRQTLADGRQAVNLVRKMILEFLKVLSERGVSVDKSNAKEAILFRELASCEQAFQQLAIEGIPEVVLLLYRLQNLRGWDVLLPDVLAGFDSSGDAVFGFLLSNCQFRQRFRYRCAGLPRHKGGPTYHYRANAHMRHCTHPPTPDGPLTPSLQDESARRTTKHGGSVVPSSCGKGSQANYPCAAPMRPTWPQTALWETASGLSPGSYRFADRTAIAPAIQQRGRAQGLFNLSGIDHFGAPIEEQLPLRALDLDRLSFLRRTRTLSRRFAVVDERQRVPSTPALDADFRRARPQGREDGVLAHAPEPVPRIPRVGLLPVHHGVPVASLRGVEILGHAVRFFPARKVEVQPRQHRRTEARRPQQAARLHRTARAARQRHQPLAVSIQRQNAGDFVTIRIRIEHGIYLTPLSGGLAAVFGNGFRFEHPFQKFACFRLAVTRHLQADPLMEKPIHVRNQPGDLAQNEEWDARILQ